MKSIIVIPCFNEAQRIPVNTFCEFLNNEHPVKFQFVDDGSIDDTFQILKSINIRFPESTDVLQLKKNKGKAEAVRQGMLLALSKEPNFVGYWDADLSTPLTEIPRFINIFSSNLEIEWVFGSRVKLLGRHIERNLFRHYLGRLFATCVSIVLNLPIYDSQCGAKMFRASRELEKLIAKEFRSKWIFDVELLARLKKYRKKRKKNSLNETVYEVPLKTWVDVKGSKLKGKDFIWAVIDLLIILKYLYSKNNN